MVTATTRGIAVREEAGIAVGVDTTGTAAGADIAEGESAAGTAGTAVAGCTL